MYATRDSKLKAVRVAHEMHARVDSLVNLVGACEAKEYARGMRDSIENVKLQFHRNMPTGYVREDESVFDYAVARPHIGRHGERREMFFMGITEKTSTHVVDIYLAQSME